MELLITSSTPPPITLSTSNSSTANDAQSSSVLTPAQHWQSFRSYTKAIRGKQYTAFEDKQAKASERAKRSERQWIRSNEEYSAFFDFCEIGQQPQAFMAALKQQIPAAVGHIAAPKKYNGAIVAFQDAASCTQACTIGVSFMNKTILGTPTLNAENEVYRVNLEQLPLLHEDRLTPLLHKALAHFGKVHHIGLFFDPITTMFYGKGYAIIDTSTVDSTVAYEPLKHVIQLLDRRHILTTWQGMERHCFYCHRPGHVVVECPDITKLGKNDCTCRGCGSPKHYIRECPKVNNGETGDKRTRTDDGTDIRKDIDTNTSTSNSGDRNNTNEFSNNDKSMNDNQSSFTNNKTDKTVVKTIEDTTFAETSIITNDNTPSTEDHLHDDASSITAPQDKNLPHPNNDEEDTDSDDDIEINEMKSSTLRLALRPCGKNGKKGKKQQVSHHRQAKQKEIANRGSTIVNQHPLTAAPLTQITSDGGITPEKSNLTHQ